MKRSEIILTVILALVTIGITVAIILTAIHAGKEPGEPTDPVDTTDITAPDTGDEVIPPPAQDTDTEKPDDSAESTEPNNGEVNLDIGERNNNGHEDAPGVVGDVVVIPGIKKGDGE